MPQDELDSENQDDGPGALAGNSRLRVGSWPGHEARANAFVANFLDCLASDGCEIVNLSDPATFSGADVDVLILHWLERLFWTSRSDLDLFRRVAGFVKALRTVPERTRIVWLVHNLAPHEQRRLHGWIWRFLVPVVARRTDAVLTLSPGTVPQVREAIPGLVQCPALGCHHPAYRLSPVAAGGEMRRRLGISGDSRVVGYVGNLRPYKGLHSLVHAFSQLPDRNLRLLLAGRASAHDRDVLAALAAGDPRITIEARRLDADEFDACLLACDLVVAPFRDYLHSGSMVHALCAGRPLLTPDTPFSRSLAEEVGAQWVMTHDGALTAAELGRALGRLPDAGAPNLAAFQPDRVGREVGAFLREVCAAPRVTRGGGQTSARLRMAGFQ